MPEPVKTTKEDTRKSMEDMRREAQAERKRKAAAVAPVITMSKVELDALNDSLRHCEVTKQDAHRDAARARSESEAAKRRVLMLERRIAELENLLAGSSARNE